MTASTTRAEVLVDAIVSILERLERWLPGLPSDHLGIDHALLYRTLNLGGQLAIAQWKKELQRSGRFCDPADLFLLTSFLLVLEAQVTMPPPLPQVLAATAS